MYVTRVAIRGRLNLKNAELSSSEETMIIF